MQQITLVGRATKDAETLTSKTGKIYSKFTLAINQYMGKDQEDKTYYYDVLVFDKTAPIVVEKVKKGNKVFVFGRPEVDAYISKKDSEAKATISVLANQWDAL